MPDADQSALREAVKRTAVALKEAGLRFALAGGYAAWARGGPESAHDVDFLIAERDADKASASLSGAGLEVLDAPEDWLLKVRAEGVVVDLIFRAGRMQVDDEMLDRAEDLEVLSVVMPVMEATDLLASKLRSINEHSCDFGALLPVTRALREQVDWPRLRDLVQENDFAVAYLVLLERLGIAPAAGADGRRVSR